MINKMKVVAVTPNGRLLKHPSGSVIGSDGKGQWPTDAFTFRRINDGDIKEDTTNPTQKSDRK